MGQTIRGFAFIAALLGAYSGNVIAAQLNQLTKTRHPVAVVSVGKWLLVANRRSGSVSVVDTTTHSVVNEIAVGNQLADLTLLNDGHTLLVVDENQHQLIILSRDNSDLKIVERIPVEYSPVNVVASQNGKRVSVASLWSRRVTLLSVAHPSGNSAASLASEYVVDLPFAPRKQWMSPDGKRLVVADSFGGHFGVIDASQGKLVAVRTIEGHNIRGIAVNYDRDELLVTHQILNGRMPTVRERIFWGAVLGNIVKSIEFKEFFKTIETNGETGSVPEQPIVHWSLLPLGRPSDAAGDPGEVAVSEKGATVVLLGGVNQVAIRTSPRQPMSRRDVGRRPIDVTLSPDKRAAYVANMLDDSISVIEVEDMNVAKTISLGPSPDLSLADQGERLFFDAKLSLDGWYSCHSCHTDGHTCGLLNDNFGDDSYGAPKRILSLLGVGDTGPWAWTGQQSELKTQLHKSITVTMQGEEEGANDGNLTALEAYLKTLRPPPSINEARGIADSPGLRRGRVVFRENGCIDCHREPTFTAPAAFDVDLEDEIGTKEFNPPSLRGVSQRDGFFHDNRASQLEDVFRKHHHQGGGDLSDDDFQSLVMYLKSL